jgi:hypothetical protein
VAWQATPRGAQITPRAQLSPRPSPRGLLSPRPLPSPRYGNKPSPRKPEPVSVVLTLQQHAEMECLQACPGPTRSPAPRPACMRFLGLAKSMAWPCLCRGAAGRAS